MKKVLYATTALVATAGFASAQVADDVVVADPTVAAAEPVVVAEPVADVDPVGVVLTGSAEIGVFDPGDDGDLQFHTDIDVTFTMAGETDGGLSFGANIDLDESDTDRTLPLAVNREGDAGGGAITGVDDLEVGGSPAFDNDTQGGESIFLSGPFGTLTAGDTDGAFDWALEEAIIGSAINDEHEHAGYNGNQGLDGAYDGQIVRYEYTFGGLGVAVSAELDDDRDNIAEDFRVLGDRGGATEGDPVLGIGARYSTGFNVGTNEIGVGLGVGYQRIDAFTPFQDLEDLLEGEEEDFEDDVNREVYGISADFAFAEGLRAIVNYSEGDDRNGNGFDHVGVALGYTFDAWTVAANWGRFNNAPVLILDDEGAIDLDVEGNPQFADADTSGYGLVVNYDLTSGAEAQFGYSRGEVGDVDQDRYSLGVAMAF